MSNLVFKESNIMSGVNCLGSGLMAHSSVSSNSMFDILNLFLQSDQFRIEGFLLFCSEISESLVQIPQIVKDLPQNTLVSEILFSGQVE